MTPDDIMGLDLPDLTPVEHSDEGRRVFSRSRVHTGLARNCRNKPELCRVITGNSELLTMSRRFWRLRKPEGAA